MLRKKIIVLVVLINSVGLFAQDSVRKDTAWKMGGQVVFTVSQTSFINWASGGENSNSGNSRLGLFANYVEGKVSWENNLDIAYGLAKQGEQEVRKTDDLLELNSKFGLKASKRLNYAALLNAKSQLADGFIYPGDSTKRKISAFMAPLTASFAFGIDYKPNTNTSVFMSPINSKLVYVANETFAAKNSIDSGKVSRLDVGAIVKLKYQRDLLENVGFLTKLDLFANYKELRELKDIDVDWEILITMKVFKLISVNINTHLIWDKDVLPLLEDGSLGDAKIQFKEIFGAGISYKF